MPSSRRRAAGIALGLGFLGLAAPSRASAQAVVSPALRPAVRSDGKLAPAAAPDGLGFGLVAQLRVSVQETGLGHDGLPVETTDSVELRRVRVSLRGRFFEGRLKTQLQLNLAPLNPELIDLWGEYEVLPSLRVRAGQTKIPFTLHRARSFADLPLVDWDAATFALGAEQQIGVMVHDGFRREGFLHYGAGAFAGPSARPTFARGVADTFRESAPNRSSFRAPPEAIELHPELVGQIGAGTKGMDLSLTSDAEGGPLRAYGGLSFAWDASPARREDFTERLAAETLLAVEHLSLNAVGYGGFVRTHGDDTSLGMLGATGEAVYRVHARADVSLRYSVTDVLPALRHEAQRYVQSLIAAADASEVDSIKSQRAGAGQTRQSHEVGVGGRVYLLGRQLTAVADAALLRDVRVADLPDRMQARIRVQVQLAL